MIAAPPNLKLQLPLEQIADFCRRWGIARLEVFGSVLRDDFRPDSDLDFLFTPGRDFQRQAAYGPGGETTWLRNCQPCLAYAISDTPRGGGGHG